MKKFQEFKIQEVKKVDKKQEVKDFVFNMMPYGLYPSQNQHPYDHNIVLTQENQFHMVVTPEKSSYDVFFQNSEPGGNRTISQTYFFTTFDYRALYDLFIFYRDVRDPKHNPVETFWRDTVLASLLKSATQMEIKTGLSAGQMKYYGLDTYFEKKLTKDNLLKFQKDVKNEMAKDEYYCADYCNCFWIGDQITIDPGQIDALALIVYMYIYHSNSIKEMVKKAFDMDVDVDVEYTKKVKNLALRVTKQIEEGVINWTDFEISIRGQNYMLPAHFDQRDLELAQILTKLA